MVTVIDYCGEIEFYNNSIKYLHTEEVTEQLEHKPGEIYVRRIIRPKYAPEEGSLRMHLYQLNYPQFYQRFCLCQR